MELRDRTVMILGGSGLVGHAVARRLLGAAPRRVVLVALFEDEVRATARALEPYRGRTTIEVEWGNVFLPASLAQLERGSVMANPEHRRLMLQDLLSELTDDVFHRSFLSRLLLKYKPDAVVDSINTATAFAYQDGLRSAQDLLALARRGEVDEAAVERHVLQLTLPQLIRHVQILVESLKRAETKAYVKIGTSGTGGMGFNIPYTHSEERPSRPLITKSAVAGAQSLLLFLLGRTPGAPATVEIKPTATIAWREIGFGPIRRKGKPIPLVDCPTPVALARAFDPDAAPWCDLGKPLEGVFIDVGENGLFAPDEFETVTALGQMEFITPEEVADYAVMELEGRPTGRDVVAALDAATAGPTYRAGMLRASALERLRALEHQTKSRSVAYEMLGPPRLTKLLWESHLCALLRPSVRALAQSRATDLAVEAQTRVERDATLRSHILSVGIPILTPDGERLYR
ncbi:MAG: short-chain dehydrogenase, partial [Gemmatimonadetes bacterium]